MIAFTIAREAGSSIGNDDKFAIIVKAVAPRQKTVIWRWNERPYAHDTWKQAMTRLLKRMNWDGERKYPNSVRPSLDEVVRLSIRYSVSLKAHDCTEAVLNITIEGNDANPYVQDEGDHRSAQSTGLQTQSPLLVAPIPAVAPLRVKRNDFVDVAPAPEGSDADTNDQNADPFADLWIEFIDLI